MNWRNMKSFQLFSVLALAVLSACNGGGGRRSVGGQCPAGVYEPIPLKVGANQIELSLKAEDGQIPEGDYSYEGAVLYFEGVNGLRMQIYDVRQSGDKFKAHVGCVRNAQRPLSPFSISGIRSLNVDKVDPKKIVAEVTDYNVHSDGKYVTEATKNPSKSLQSPAEAYQTSRAIMLSYKNNDVNYEIRSTTKDAYGEYFLKINLKRTKKP